VGGGGPREPNLPTLFRPGSQTMPECRLNINHRNFKRLLKRHSSIDRIQGVLTIAEVYSQSRCNPTPWTCHWENVAVHQPDNPTTQRLEMLREMLRRSFETPVERRLLPAWRFDKWSHKPCSNWSFRPVHLDYLSYAPCTVVRSRECLDLTSKRV